MNYQFDQIINRRNTNSFKWDGSEFIKELGLTTHYDEQTLPLFTADMDLPVPQPIIDALHRVADQKIFGYTIVPNSYYDAITSWFSRNYNWAIEKQSIVYCPGTVHAIHVAINSFTVEGQGIIIQRPVYPPFTSAIEDSGRVVVNNALKRDKSGYYTIDFEDFELKAKEPTTKMFLLCNPHNPTGRIYSEQDLQKLAEICVENDVMIVADEIHADLIRQEYTFIPIAKVAPPEAKLITLTAINKTFNVAGLHCTNVIIPDESLRLKFQKHLGSLSPTPFTIAALIAAYTESDDWLEQLKVYIDDTIDWTLSFLREHMSQVKVQRPEGTYVLWMDFEAYGLTPEEVHDRIYNKANVLLEDGILFGEEGKHYQRICLPSPRPMIEEALTRIAKEFQDVPQLNNV